MRPRVVVAEDETDMLHVLTWNLRRAGLDVMGAGTASECLEAVRLHKPDLLLLDWMLPDSPGTEVCRQLRRQAEFARLPILMVTARAEEIDRVVGFEVGVDDYVTKPFSVRELVLRVNAILRRTTPTTLPKPASEIIGTLTIELDRFQAYTPEATIDLTELEARILRTLAAHRERVVPREDLVRMIWGEQDEVSTTALDSHIKRLRTKMGDAGRLLQTVRGIGYLLSESERLSR
jgi:two-component system phosphate regulon response regulator PhoB